MERVPLKDLKLNLSRWAEEASKGAVIEVTKHNRPYIIVRGSEPGHLLIGERVGGQELSPALERDPTNGRWLQFLQEDRDE